MGGGGSNAVIRMVGDIAGAELWVVNTDVQALAAAPIPPHHKLQIGSQLTRGLGAGGQPEIGLVSRLCAAPCVCPCAEKSMYLWQATALVHLMAQRYLG